jgi:hypothetical protein
VEVLNSAINANFLISKLPQNFSESRPCIARIFLMQQTPPKVRRL